MPTTRVLRLGTRGSALAKWQANFVADRLRTGGHEIEIIEITTWGDVERSKPIESVGVSGIFTKAIQRALLDGHIDLAVHSLKDLPARPANGLMLAAIPVRGDPSDALVTRAPTPESTSDPAITRDPAAPSVRVACATMNDLPTGARIGTGSPRRRAQLLRARPDLLPMSIRGNVDTRLAKLDAGDYDALILASAGLERLGLAGRITERLPLAAFTPAAGQGALAVECRADDDEAITLASSIDNAQMHRAALAERAVLAGLGAGCTTAIGAICSFRQGSLQLVATILSRDGGKQLTESAVGPLNAPQDLGHRVADALLSRGAVGIL